MKIDIGDIFIIGIFVLLAALIYIVNKHLHIISDTICDCGTGVNESINELNGKVLIANGLISKSISELETFRREFALSFDSDFKKKVNEIISAGEKTADMMKKFNPETGKDELVPIDHGW